MNEVRKPLLAPHVRYRWDKVRGQHQLLFPEGILVLNETGAAIVQLCDGRATSELVSALRERFPGDPLAEDICDFLERLARKGLLRDAAD